MGVRFYATFWSIASRYFWNWTLSQFSLFFDALTRAGGRKYSNVDRSANDRVINLNIFV